MKKVIKPKYDHVNVKISKEVLDLVKENKKKTFVPITSFVEQAILEALKKQK